MNLEEFRLIRKLRRERAILRKLLTVNNKKMSTEDARNLHMWSLGMIIEGRQPIRRYFETCAVIEWYTKMDNVILRQADEIQRLRDKK